MKKGDKLLIIVLAAALIAGYGTIYYRDHFSQTRATGAIIKVDGKVYKTISSSQMQSDATFTIDIPTGGYNVVDINGGRIRVKAADCRDKICVNTGWISKPGETIVCLPHRLIIQITGQAQDIDSLSY